MAGKYSTSLKEESAHDICTWGGLAEFMVSDVLRYLDTEVFKVVGNSSIWLVHDR